MPLATVSPAVACIWLDLANDAQPVLAGRARGRIAPKCVPTPQREAVPQGAHRGGSSRYRELFRRTPEYDAPSRRRRLAGELGAAIDSEPSALSAPGSSPPHLYRHQPADTRAIDRAMPAIFTAPCVADIKGEAAAEEQFDRPGT